jgi:NADH dehydrogenase
MGGAIAELARRALAADFRFIDPGTTRIVLVEAGPRLLSTFPESLSENARLALERLGVEVCLGVAVTHCDDAGVRIGDRAIGARNIIWAAGVMASPAASWLEAAHDKAGRVKVAADFSVPGFPEVFVVGDTASLVDAGGRPLPGLAPAAKQAGHHVAAQIAARVTGKPAPAPFRYGDYGNLATVGRKAAVADFGRLRLTGFPAWLLWSVAHIYFLISLRSRFAVALNWLWNYVTFQRGARLITGTEGDDSGAQSAAAVLPDP